MTLFRLHIFGNHGLHAEIKAQEKDHQQVSSSSESKLNGRSTVNAIISYKFRHEENIEI